MTKKLIMILGLVLSSMLMKAQAFFCAFPEGWRQVLAEAGARSDAQRLYPVGQSLSEEEGGEYGQIHHHDVYQRPYLREFLGCPGSECSEYQHPLSLWSLSPE